VRGCRWTTLDELEQRRAEWRDLLSTSEFPNAFADPAWVLAWWRCYGERREPWCLTLENTDGSLAGVTVLALAPKLLGRTLLFAGGAWNGVETLVCAPGDEAEFSELLLDALATRRREWDTWRAQRLPANSALARMLLDGSGALRAAASNVRLQPFIQLPSTVEDFEARFASKRRNTQRRKDKRLTALGAKTRLVRDPEEVEPALRRLLELRRARAIEQGQSHAHMDRRFERFLLAAVRGLLPDGARLWTFELAGYTLAMRLNLVAGAREHSYLLGLGQEHRKLSPGSSLERQAIHHAIIDGCTEYDCGPGRDEYKYRWEAIDRELTRLVVVSGSSRARITGVATALDLRLRDTAAADALRRRRGIASTHLGP
jgi:CelD/BcsL family acetyltransferase involved in cellulose biosynthesis